MVFGVDAMTALVEKAASPTLLPTTRSFLPRFINGGAGNAPKQFLLFLLGFFSFSSSLEEKGSSVITQN